MTDLDRAYAAMIAAAEDDDAPRLRYYGLLADGEMILLLEAEASAGVVAPRVFTLEDGPVVLVFDSEEKLSAFSAGMAPYAALPGRVIAQQLAGQGIGLAVNMGAPSMMLFPPDAVDWLSQALEGGPEAAEGRPEAYLAPAIPQAVLRALDAKLARAAGLAAGAVLAGVRYAGGRRGHLLAFLGAEPAAEGALARAVRDALVFSGIEAGELDVVFLGVDEVAAQAIGRVGLRFDLTAPAKPQPAPVTPGPDPSRPPRLR